MINIPVPDWSRRLHLRAVHPHKVEHAFLALQIHRQPLEAVSYFSEYGTAHEASYFLKVGELRDLHAVEPDLPSQAPCAERRRFPVVFHKADVVRACIDPERLQRL